MSQIAVKYQLKNPKSRSNPFTISPGVVFKDGTCILVIEHDNVELVDKTLAAYGAFRVKEEDNGKDPDETDGSIGDGETDAGGDDGDDLSEETLGGVDGGEADQGNKGDKGSETPGDDGQSAEIPTVEPVAKLTKAEAKAGLDNLQAASYRASGSKNPVEWLAAHNAAIAAIAVAVEGGDNKTPNEDDLV